MEKPSKRVIALLVFLGFLLALLEPLILLLMGDDLGGAFWPMAKRSLDWTYFLRDYKTVIFAFFLLAVPYSYYRSQKASNLEKTNFYHNYWSRSRFAGNFFSSKLGILQRCIFTSTNHLWISVALLCTDYSRTSKKSIRYKK